MSLENVLLADICAPPIYIVFRFLCSFIFLGRNTFWRLKMEMRRMFCWTNKWRGLTTNDGWQQVLIAVVYKNDIKADPNSFNAHFTSTLQKENICKLNFLYLSSSIRIWTECLLIMSPLLEFLSSVWTF